VALPRTRTGIDKRRHPRHPRRIPCELWIRGTRYTGIVKDVSSAGLFVQTRAQAGPGTALTLVIPPGNERTEIRVDGCVVRTDRVRARLAMQAAAGIGIAVAAGALEPLLRAQG
jgi:PilZ domain-containing protein